MGYNLSDPLDQARTGRVLAKRNMGPHLVIVGGVSHKNSSKVVCVERDQMVCALAPDRSDQAFSMSVLPGRAIRGRPVPDSHGAHPSLVGAAIGSAVVADEIFGRRVKEALVILLTGGIKKRQPRDIEHAKALWADYKRRRKPPAR
jgi:hypothetical protein